MKKFFIVLIVFPFQVYANNISQTEDPVEFTSLVVSQALMEIRKKGMNN